MKISDLKKELHLAIDRINDDHLLEAVYVILNKSTNDYVLTAEQEKEVYRRLEAHKKGEVKYIPAKKAMKEIRQKVKK